MSRKHHDDEARQRRAEAVGARGDKLDTLEIQKKLAGRQRPPPSRGVEAIAEKATDRRAALVVGALPAHVEVVFDDDVAGGQLDRSHVHVVKVHPALVAVLQSPLVVGDRIVVAVLQSGQLYAVECEPRPSLLARPVVERDKLPQPLVAGAGVLWVVVACAKPPLRPGLVDRFFVAAAAGGLVPRLCATKLDLPAEEGSDDWLGVYERLGFTVVRTSVVTNEGIDEMRARLAGDFSVLVGQSGVGKSSLVRVLVPGEPIAIGEMSQATGKGRHTTTVTRYYGLAGGGAVVDTPGLRELGLWNASRAHLDVAFPDIADLARACRFDDCRHAREPGCAVSRDRSLHPERLSSFNKLSEEIDEKLRPGYGKPGGPRGQGG